MNLEKKNFFKPPEKRNSMITNINNLFYRMEPNDKEIRILGSLIGSLSKNKTGLCKGSRGPCNFTGVAQLVE